MTEDTSPENLRKFLESDDLAMVRMGLSMAKGTGVSDNLLALICGLYMWHDDTKVRATAKSTFMKLAPDDVKAIIKEKWKSNYRTRRYPVSDFCPECGQPRTSHHKSCCVRFVSVNILEDLFAGLNDTSLNKIFLWIPAITSGMGSHIRKMITLHYPSESLNLFLDLLKHDESYVRSNAVHDIGVITGTYVSMMPKSTPQLYPNPVFRTSQTEKKSLTEIQIEEATDALIWTLEDEDEDVRGRAAAVLSTLEKKRIMESLITALANDAERPNPAVATALGNIGDEQSFEPLVKALSAASEVTMWRAAEALLHFGTTRVVEHFIKALENGGSVSWFVAGELGKIGDARAVEPLIKVLGDEHSKSVAKALDKLGWKPETEEQRAAYLLAVEDWKSLVECGKPAVVSLIGVLLSGHWMVRSHAAEALGKIGDVRAVESLIEALSYDEGGWSDHFVRQHAAEALWKIGDVRAVEPLIKALEDEDDDVRKAAKEALKKFGHEVK